MCPTSWNDTLAARRDGLVPLFRGDDESLEAYAARMAAHAAAKAADAAAPAPPPPAGFAQVPAPVAVPGA